MLCLPEITANHGGTEDREGYITLAQFASDHFPAVVRRGHEEHEEDTKNTTS